MSGPSWLVDSRRIAKKIKSASERCDPKNVNWKSNPSRACPNCNHIIDNSDVNHEWPGLPGGVKFDPTDQEIIWHLHAKVGIGNVKPHPFIEEFIPTVNEEDGICYTHPQRLPGVTQDGSVSHFFHRAIKAYNTGTRKRRKIHGDDSGDVRWHKTGRTKPVISDGIQMGCKKIMVLYMSTANSKKPEKTNWVMHQYHLGTGEDEQDGEFVVSKIFYQQQAKINDKAEQDISCDMTEASITTDAPITKVDPVTPKSVIPEPPRNERWQSDVDIGQEHESSVLVPSVQNHAMRSFDEVQAEGMLDDHSNDTTAQENDTVGDHEDIVEDPKVLAGESQYVFDSQQFDLFNSQQFDLLNSQQFELLNSQQLIEGLSLGDELLQSQPSGVEKDDSRALLSDYSRLGVEAFKKDIEECQKLGPLELFPNSGAKKILRDSENDCGQGAEDSNKNLEEFRSMGQLDQLNNAFDTPPEFRLSQLEFNSQDSFAWAGSRFSE